MTFCLQNFAAYFVIVSFMCYSRFSQTFFPTGNLKIIFISQRNPCLWKLEHNKRAVCSARRLYQYCQIPDKDFCDISCGIQKFSRYFRNFIFFTISRGTTDFREILLGKHCSSHHHRPITGVTSGIPCVG
jgi:hypothetical protein